MQGHQMDQEEQWEEICGLYPPGTMSDPWNPVVFMDISIDGQSAGRMELELYKDTVPKTAENFRALCTGDDQQR